MCLFITLRPEYWFKIRTFVLAMKENIARLKDCYGCGVCVKACPVDIISLRENADGFYSPVIERQDKCIECGRCLKVCAFNHADVAADNTVPEAFAAWSLDPGTRWKCSSGGVGFELGRLLLEDGFKAVGVRYDSACRRAEHYISFTEDEFHASMGSKYIPSDMTSALGAIAKGERYLVTGTPCQIDSFRRYIRLQKCEDDFVLLDFFCHGVPSLLLWDKYITEVQHIAPIADSVSWRDKATGWHDSYAITALRDGRQTYCSRMSQGDLFYDFFLGNYCLNTCCYKSCKYKMLSSAADIRIGDLWGSSFRADEKGVSGMLALTPCGRRMVEKLRCHCHIEESTAATVTEEQMVKAPVMPSIWPRLIEQLRSSRSLVSIRKGLIFRYRLRFLPHRILNRLKMLVRR